MSTYYKSLREFAKLAKVSPQRLKDLIDEGKIEIHEGGLIHVNQLRYFSRERLLNCIAGKGCGVLYVAIDKSAEEMQEYISAVDDGMIVAANIDELVSILERNGAEKARSLSGESDVMIRYKKAILKELVKRMKSAIPRHLSKYFEDSEISQIPLGCIYELMLYGEVYSDGFDKELAKKYCENPLRDMEQTFETLVENLNLYDAASGSPLLSQEDISPEFVCGVEQLEIDTGFPKDPALSNIFSKSFCMGLDKRGRGKDSQKIAESIAHQVSSSAKISAISSITSKGFCTFLNVTDDLPLDSIYKLSNDLSSGFYSEVRFLCSQEYASEHLNDSLAIMFNALAIAHRLQLNYT